jgi:putative endonuclease
LPCHPELVEGSPTAAESSSGVKTYYIYMMTNKGRTTLYIGVTNSLMRRVSQHRQSEIPGFSKRYNTNRLVYYEPCSDIRVAIAREKQLKGWSRSKKEALINTMNPQWTDLAEEVLGLGEAPATQWQERRGWQAGDPSTSSG